MCVCAVYNLYMRVCELGIDLRRPVDREENTKRGGWRKPTINDWTRNEEERSSKEDTAGRERESAKKEHGRSSWVNGFVIALIDRQVSR